MDFLAAAGIGTLVKKYYEYVDIEVHAQKDWDFSVHGSGFRQSGEKDYSAWPAPIIRNNNTLRIYTQKNNTNNTIAPVRTKRKLWKLCNSCIIGLAASWKSICQGTGFDANVVLLIIKVSIAIKNFLIIIYVKI